MTLKSLSLKQTALSLLSVSALALMACGDSMETTTSEIVTTHNVNLLDYPLSSVLSCLPDENALVAAHRGTSRSWDIPENSLEGLTRLIDAGTLIAEIDIAGLKDGEHILFKTLKGQNILRSGF